MSLKSTQTEIKICSFHIKAIYFASQRVHIGAVFFKCCPLYHECDQAATSGEKLQQLQGEGGGPGMRWKPLPSSLHNCGLSDCSQILGTLLQR